MIRRLIRVAPPYWAATIAMLAALALFQGHVSHGETSLGQVLGSFLFFPVPDPYGKFYPVVILGWTLNFEMLFYAVFAVGLLFSRAAGLAWIIGVLAVLGTLPFLTTLRSAPFAFWANPIVFEFLFGIGLAALRARGLRVGPLAGWSLFAAGFALMALLQTGGVAGNDFLLRPLWMGIPALVACAGPALIREAPNEHPGPLMRALVFGGDISFALYLSHPFSINLVALLSPRMGIHDPTLYMAVAGVAALVAAAAFYLLFERPLTLALNGWLHRRPPRALAEVPSSQ